MDHERFYGLSVSVRSSREASRNRCGTILARMTHEDADALLEDLATQSAQEPSIARRDTYAMSYDIDDLQHHLSNVCCCV